MIHVASKFELVINLKTVKALGLTIPSGMIATGPIGDRSVAASSLSTVADL